MTKQEKIVAEQNLVAHENIHIARAAAQAVMKAPAKNAENPGFMRGKQPAKYADLDSVVESVREPLTANGISWRHEMKNEDGGWVMVTVLDHGTSGTSIECPVPLFVDRQNMHGLKSAITYAKRIGLESVTGQAPGDDDDGNAAAAAPQGRKQEPKPDAISSAVTSLNNASGLDQLRAIWSGLPKDIQSQARAVKAKDDRKAALETTPAPILEDEIPY
jgi:hypothetical protein